MTLRPLSAKNQEIRRLLKLYDGHVALVAELLNMRANKLSEKLWSSPGLREWWPGFKKKLSKERKRARWRRQLARRKERAALGAPQATEWVGSES